MSHAIVKHFNSLTTNLTCTFPSYFFNLKQTPKIIDEIQNNANSVFIKHEKSSSDRCLRIKNTSAINWTISCQLRLEADKLYADCPTMSIKISVIRDIPDIVGHIMMIMKGGQIAVKNILRVCDIFPYVSLTFGILK